MKFWSRRSRRSRVAGATALTLAVGTLVALAIDYDGAPIHDVELNDGSVWVTKGDLLGRLNSQVRELDLGLVTSSSPEQVFQEGSDVQAFDADTGDTVRNLHLVDPVRGRAQPIALDKTYQAAAGRGVVAILDDKTGKAWLLRQDQLATFGDDTQADLKVAQRGSVAMTRTGTALFLDRTKGEVQAWVVDPSGTAVHQRTWDFDTEFVDDAALTAVGQTPVVAQAGKVLLPGGDEVEVDPDVVLQEVGPEADDVHVATAEGLFRVPLGGGDPEEVSGLDVDGPPAPPTVVAGCVHGAWAQPGVKNYVRLCRDADPAQAAVPSVDATSRLVFRSNRDVVVLNDVASGNAWLLQEKGITLVNNWNSVDPRAKSQQKTKLAEEDQSEGRNQPPEAQPDTFGARPGTTVVLPVTLNDRDPDGDILTMPRPPSPVKGAAFAVVGNGTQVQATVPADARGTINFSYEITDGHPQNRAAVGEVELRVVEKQDTAPVKIERQQNALTVADGFATSVNVLPAWIDPEGDTLVLTKATSKDGTVRFRPDGTIDFTDDGSGPGPAKIDFEVRGGDKTAKGVVDVTVVEEDRAAPTTVADRFVGSVGSSILLEPLKNDSDPFGQQLRVTRLDLPGGESVEYSLDPAGRTATFRADKAGSYYLEYDAVGSNGRATTEPKRIRVDVLPVTDDNNPPVATRDVAVVRPESAALVDVLANDSDPDNDVLVVQGVTVKPEFQGLVKASLVDKRFVRVESTAPLQDRKPEVEYLLSDGKADPVPGTVSVTTGEAGKNRAPLAREDVVTARAGTIITIPVLDNDEDPDADKLTVDQADLADIAGGTVIAGGKVPIVATGSAIRLLVPDDPKVTELAFTYGARDPQRLRHDARVLVSIRPDTAKGNLAPQPPPIVDRTVVGQRIRVPVDAFEADPDGDPVVLAGVLDPPKLGRIGRTGSNWFDYEPFEDGETTGTDSFKVLVADGYGKTGVAQVRIGVAPQAAENQPPAALNDQVLVKPGRTIRYPVLQNDSDPDGDRLAIARDQFETPAGVKAEIVKDAIEMRVPELDGRTEVVATAQYAATDGLGTTSTALLELVGRADAPDHAPIAQDDVARPDDFEGKRAGDTLDIDVLANDGDLDGPKGELTIEPMAPRISSVVDGKLRITLGKDSRVVPYRVVDGDEQSSFGFVYVPGAETMPPTLDTTAVPIDVVAGREARIDLDDVVVVRPGRSPRIARLDEVVASKGDARPRGNEGFTFRAAPDYHGRASVTLEVLDGDGLNDPTALSSQITVPINVLPSRNVDPEVRSASVVVPAGAEPLRLDLTRLAADANAEDRLTFSVSEGNEGLDATVEGDEVLELAAERIAPSSDQELVLTVSDGKGGKAQATVAVQVVGLPSPSKTDEALLQPPMTLGPLSFPDAAMGRPVTVDVTDAVLTDPFPKERKKITWHQLEAGAARVAARGTTLTITPTRRTEIVLNYKLSDGSGVPARDAVGQVTVTAAGIPGRPGRPRATGNGASSVALSWTAPADNGRPIRGYRVTYAGGSTNCPSTSCVVKGLTPGRSYTFQVQAVNELGPSAKSRPSNAVKPDKAPERMAAPVITSAFADRNGKLRLRWSPPRNEGSAIVAYEFQASPRTSGGGMVDRTAPAGQRALTWTGLRNGTRYTFRVRARNGAAAGPWSAASIATAPFTRPSPMPAPRLRALDNGQLGSNAGYLVVSWAPVVAPGNGYDKVTSYSVRIFRNGRVVSAVRVDGSRTSRAFDVRNGYSWTAQVRATNRAGVGTWSGKSAAQITWDRASAPTRIRAALHCHDRSLCASGTNHYYPRLAFRTPASNGGFPVVAYEYRTEDGRVARFGAPTKALSADVRGVRVRFNGPWSLSDSNGKRLRLIPYTKVPGRAQLVQGASNANGGFKPWARPFAPTRIATTATKSVVFNCRRGNGRKVNHDLIQSKTSSGWELVGRVYDDYGCRRIRIGWSYIPKGARRCATLVVYNAYARSEPRRLCTPYAR